MTDPAADLGAEVAAVPEAQVPDANPRRAGMAAVELAHDAQRRANEFVAAPAPPVAVGLSFEHRIPGEVVAALRRQADAMLERSVRGLADADRLMPLDPRPSRLRRRAAERHDRDRQGNFYPHTAFTDAGQAAVRDPVGMQTTAVALRDLRRDYNERPGAPRREPRARDRRDTGGDRAERRRQDTLLRILATLLRPTGGSVEVLGAELPRQAYLARADRLPRPLGVALPRLR